MVEGAGRRSVVQISGCSIRCAHCHAKEAFDPNDGVIEDQ
ncbi:MAG: 4Fe-4S cluster-binding domain-containing protein [Pyrinomonadaceae bacterium]